MNLPTATQTTTRSNMTLNALYRIVILTSVFHVAELQEPAEDEAAPLHQQAAVATDVSQCSTMSKDILRQGGSAVDAAITAALCIGVVNPHRSGIGGGFTMVVYTHETQEAEALLSVEKAPAAATPDMYEDRAAGETGVRTIAVPGEISGFWAAHQKYSKVAWTDLFEPVIRMAESGFEVAPHLLYIVNLLKDNCTLIRDLYSRDYGTIVQEGDTLRSPELAETLRKIADNGPEEFYSGSVARDKLLDIEEAGGLLTEEDLGNFNSEWSHVVSTTFKNGLHMHSAPLTSSGPILNYILSVLDEFDITSEDFANDDRKLLLYHRFLEAGKFGFALRFHLGDEPESELVQKILAAIASKDFARETASLINDTYVTHGTRYGYDMSDDISEITRRITTTMATMGEGNREVTDEDKITGDTAHISVLAENGDAVSLTTSVGFYFGSKFYSKRTGILFNNHMFNFFFPKRECIPMWHWPTANGIAPNKRYMTAVSPSIFTDDSGDVKMVVGASGGQRITPTNAWVILRTLWMGSSLKEAIDERRIYNYLHESNSAFYEPGFPKDLIDRLSDMGHISRLQDIYAVSESVLRLDDGTLKVYSDPRKGGCID